MRRNPQHRRSVRARGVTIAELLVVIGVMSVILGMLLPALRGARLSALELAILAHQRQSGVLVTIYTNDHGGQLPGYGVPGTDYAPLKYHHGDSEGESIYGEPGWWIGQQFHWAYYMESLGYDVTPMRTGPEYPTYDTGHARTHSHDDMTLAAFAAPRFFGPLEAQTVDRLGPQRMNIVRFPSDKIILRRRNLPWSRENPGATEEQRAQAREFWWFADGHSDAIPPADLREAVPIRSHTDDGIPGMTTADGLHGRDT